MPAGSTRPAVAHAGLLLPHGATASSGTALPCGCFEAAALHSHLWCVDQLQPALSWHLEVCGPVLVPKGVPAQDMHLLLWLHLARCVL